jgi:hypothetical protein
MRVGSIDEAGYTYLGDFAACEPWAARLMQCDKCMVTWVGCWDNFQCPKCEDGELPSNSVQELMK